jgi:hypothetical protein
LRCGQKDVLTLRMGSARMVQRSVVPVLFQRSLSGDTKTAPLGDTKTDPLLYT